MQPVYEFSVACIDAASSQLYHIAINTLVSTTVIYGMSLDTTNKVRSIATYTAVEGCENNK